MPCERVDTQRWGAAIVCSHVARPKPCAICGQRSSKLCDFPLTGRLAGQTCSRPLCVACAVHQKPDLDFCPVHAKMLLEKA